MSTYLSMKVCQALTCLRKLIVRNRFHCNKRPNFHILLSRKWDIFEQECDIVHALEALAFIINVDDFLTLDAQSLAIHIEVKIFIKSHSHFHWPTFSRICYQHFNRFRKAIAEKTRILYVNIFSQINCKS